VKTRAQLVLLFAFLNSCVERGDVLTLRHEDSGAANTIRALDVSAGDRHSCAVVNALTYCWGTNDRGQLGIGNSNDQLTAALVAGGIVWRQVTAGASHTCAIDDVGQVYCWGNNDNGQLGLGDRSERTTPTLVDLPQPATQISAKFGHSCALLLNSGLYCWGANREGQLGQADLFPSNDDTAADGLSPLPVGDNDWRAMDTGEGHTCGIRLDGGLWCWGRNSEHELGPDNNIQIREPIQVTTDGPWLAVAAGQSHTCALKQDRSLWCWGSNTGSDTNDGFPLGIDGAGLLDVPTRVGGASDWTLIRTNTFHSCAINRAEELYCWGRNTEGQLGMGDVVPRNVPTRAAAGVLSVSPGRFTTCEITDLGEVRCAGENAQAQLGTGDHARRSEFTVVPIAPP
jgi:alpha-tubulin suppressor-like RCC1 family protein